MSPIYKKYISKSRRETAARKRVAERPQPAKPDWETLRPLILAKSDGCYLCGEPLNDESMTADHMNVRPRGCKKNDELGNLMPCCFTCNWRKGSRRLTGKECSCGQRFIVSGLGCLRCKRLSKHGVRVVRTGRFEI